MTTQTKYLAAAAVIVVGVLLLLRKGAAATVQQPQVVYVQQASGGGGQGAAPAGWAGQVLRSGASVTSASLSAGLKPVTNITSGNWKGATAEALTGGLSDLL